MLQLVIAYGASFPTLIAGLGLTATSAAKVSAIITGIVFVASALQNVLEHFNVIPTIGGKLPVTGATK